MEKQLFDWTDWDQIDITIFQFEGIITKVQIGPHPPGSHFDWAVVNYDKGELQLGLGTESDSYQLALRVV